MGLLGRGLEVKDEDQVRLMRRAGLVVGETLALLRDAVAPGVTTADLDALAEQSIRSRGATPSFLGYQGFPASICTSVNHEVVHGIPGGRVLAEGDLVSIDCGAAAASRRVRSYADAALRPSAQILWLPQML